NFIRLCRAEDGKELVKMLAPRSDLVQTIIFSLDSSIGEEVYLEVVDGLKQRTHAWIAIGRIEPPVVELPRWGTATAMARFSSASQLIADFQLHELMPEIRSILEDTESDRLVCASAALAQARLTKS